MGCTDSKTTADPPRRTTRDPNLHRDSQGNPLNDCDAAQRQAETSSQSVLARQAEQTIRINQ
jgi:hypothetical protein